MNLLDRAQKLPENTKKLIILILVALIGIGIGWIWIKLMVQDLKDFHQEDINEALKIQELKDELKQAPVPQIDIPFDPQP